MSASLRQRALRRLAVAAILGVWGFLVNPLALATGAEIDFYRDVYPILKSKCIACHNKTTTKAALNMETPEAMRKRATRAGVIPGNGVESLIFQAAARHRRPRDAAQGKQERRSNLKPDELALLKSWIDQGPRARSKRRGQVVWQPLPPGLNPIYSVAMTRDGRLAACGRANQVFVYDLATRQFVTRLADESLNPPGAGAAHRAARAVAGIQSRWDEARLGKFPRGENLAARTDRHDPKGRPGGWLRRRGAFGGRQASRVCRQAGALHVLDAADGKVLKTIPTGIQGGLTLLSLSADATKAAAYGTDGSLSLWNLEEGRRARQ